MSLFRRTICSILALAALGVGSAASAADVYPSGPVRLILPFAAGSVGDIFARLLGEKVSRELGQPLVMDNRTGANGQLGVNAVARAKPDGYMVLQITGSNVVNTALQKVPYDLKRDFTAVIGVVEGPFGLAVPTDLHINTVAELVAYMKSAPNGVNYASGGVGGLGHLAAARMAHELGVKATHVPYRGNSAAVLSLLGGQNQMLFATLLDLKDVAKGGKLKLLAVTSEQRVPSLPDVPTMLELGYKDFTPSVWYGYEVPAGTPQAIVDKLADAFAKGASDPDLKARLADYGLAIKITSGPDFANFMQQEYVRWKKVIDENDVKIEE